jgi:tetratricopeptide (TPR) repeat protein
LFALVAIPIFSFAANDLWKRIEPIVNRRPGDKGFRAASIIVFILSGIIIIGIGMRVYTNTYYSENNSYTKTGMGLDDSHLPMKAAAFLNEHHLDGKIINSLSPGGWLSWGLPQPVFIDGRLEMMGEELYKEVIQSWSGGLGNLIEKYQPSLIIYNYTQYYPWTAQLATMKSWRPIYLDGYIVVFAKEGYAVQGSRFTVHGSRSTVGDLDRVSRAVYRVPFWEGFWKGPDYNAQDEIQMSKFWQQMNIGKPVSNDQDAILAFNEGNQKYSSGDIDGAMASYTKAIELNPSYYKAYNNLGILKASALKNFPEAIADFTKAIEIDPNLPDAWLSRGTCWLGLKQLDKACPDWRKAQSLGNTQATQMLEKYCR